MTRIPLNPARWEVTYALSRKYPFQWFKWTVIILFPLLFVFFTIINLATSGFDIQTILTTDPNINESRREWYHNWFFTLGDDRLIPKCQTKDLAVGNSFLTTNDGLMYTVQSVTKHEDNRPKDEKGLPQASLAYKNQTLKNCQVDAVTADLRKSDQAAGELRYWSWKDSTAAAEAHCNISTSQGRFTLRFQVLYDAASLQLNSVLDDDWSNKSSVWWGVRLLNNHFTGMKALMAQILPQEGDDTQAYTRGRLVYRTQAGNPTIRGASLFGKPDLELSVTDGALFDNVNSANDEYNGSGRRAPIFTEGQSFAKVFYSLILVDLGDASNKPNLLLKEEDLRYILETPDNYNRAENATLNHTIGVEDTNTGVRDWWRWRGIPLPDQPWDEVHSVPFEQSWENITAAYPMGQLGTAAAQIRAEYLCSVPIQRSLASVILSTVLGNLVLLQATSVLLKFIAAQYVVAADPLAMYCEGCAGRMQHLDEETVGGIHQATQRSASSLSSTSSQIALKGQTSRLFVRGRELSMPSMQSSSTERLFSVSPIRASAPLLDIQDERQQSQITAIERPPTPPPKT